MQDRPLSGGAGLSASVRDVSEKSPLSVAMRPTPWCGNGFRRLLSGGASLPRCVRVPLLVVDGTVVFADFADSVGDAVVRSDFGVPQILVDQCLVAFVVDIAVVVRGENGAVGRQLDFSHVVACLRFVVSPQEWYHAPCFHATPQGLSESFVRNGKRDDGRKAVVPFLRLLRRRVKVRTPCGSVLRRRVSPSRNTRSPVRLRVRRAKAFRCGYTDDCRSGRRRPSPRRSGSSGRTV